MTWCAFRPGDSVVSKTAENVALENLFARGHVALCRVLFPWHVFIKEKQIERGVHVLMRTAIAVGLPEETFVTVGFCGFQSNHILYLIYQ